MRLGGELMVPLNIKPTCERGAALIRESNAAMRLVIEARRAERAERGEWQAAGSALDILAVDTYGIERLAGETDGALRKRMKSALGHR